VQVSTPLVGALVRSIGGDQVDIEVLLPAGVDRLDPAGSAPSTTVDDADLVVVVDPATYELGLADLVAGAGERSIPVVELAPQLGALSIGQTVEQRTAPPEPGSGTDPHVWLDPDRWTQAARLVATALGSLDGVSATDLEAAVATFDDALARADEQLQATVASGPTTGRTVVSDTHALAYLADRYGFDLVLPDDFGGLVPAATTLGTGRLVTSEPEPTELESRAAAAVPPVEVIRVDVDGSGLAVAPDASGATAAYTNLLLAAATALASGSGS
jgi:ABC-type Zn uptake system ZnuABC Zn-binding protein ZnuA